MIDPFVILAPVLLLAVVALLRFVGCDQVLGLQPITVQPNISDIYPISIDADALSVPFELTVNGTGFGVPGAVVLFGVVRKTPKDTSTEGQLLVDIAPDDVAAIGQVFVSVVNPNGKTSTPPLPFAVNRGMPTDVLFDNPTPPGNSGDPLSNPPPYKNLDFGSGQWKWEFRPSGSVIYFSTPGAANFSFANGKRILDNLIVYPTTAGTIKLSDGINPDVSLTFIALQVNTFQTVATDWDKFSNTVTVEFDAAPTLPIYRITYFGPP